MQTREIPSTDLMVSPLCLGTMTFGTPVGEADAIELVHYAFDKGINFIDTANMYEGYKQADAAGLTMTQYAIRWALDQTAVVSAIVGVKRAEQIDAAVAVVETENDR